MRDARCVSLIPQTTLHSDSEQFIYNGGWKTTWTWIKETGGSSTVLEEKRNKSRVKVFTQTIIGMYLCP
jgi:hypothetical protein